SLPLPSPLSPYTTLFRSSHTRMVLPLDFLLLIVITVLTITLLLVNYVAYLSRGRRYGPFYEAAALVSESVVISAFLGSAMVNLRSEEHTSELQSRGHLVC